MYDPISCSSLPSPVTFSLLDTYHLSSEASRGVHTALLLANNSDAALLLVGVRGLVPGRDYILFRVWFGK